jgi:hypothetical protein
MRVKGTIVMMGVVGLAATLGCTKAKPAADKSGQQPPKIEFGEPAKKATDNAAPKVPPRPAAEATAPAPSEPAGTLELPAGGVVAPAAAAVPVDRAAPGVDRLDSLRKALAAATDEEGRVLAVDSIADLGQNALPALDDLVKALSDENIRLRWHAARAIGRVGEDAFPVLPKVIALLKDADPIVVTQAAAAIAAIRADDNPTDLPAERSQAYSEAVDALAAVTVHPDPRARRSALRAIGKLRPEPARLAALIDDQLADADPSVVMPALDSLADLGSAAVPVLVESLKDPRSRYWATVALTEIGPEAASAAGALTAAALSGEPEERLQAMLALAAIGEPASEAADELGTALDSPDTAVRSAAAYALGRMRVASADAALEKASTDADPFLAGIASWARARIHPDNKDLVSASLKTLSTALDSDRVNTRIAAMSALADLTGSLEDADEATLAGKFVELLGDAHPGVRGAAATALVRLGPTAVAALETALDKPAIRTIALEVLAATGSTAKPAVASLVKALGDAEPSVRGDAAVALAAIGPDAAAAVPALSGLLAREAALGGADESALKYAAAYALGRIGPASAPAVEALRSLSKSEDELMASVAIWALLKIEPENKAQVESAVPVLRKALRGQRDLARLEAAAALGDLGGAAVSALPILELVSEDDPVEAVRDAAAEALVKIRASR